MSSVRTDAWKQGVAGRQAGRALLLLVIGLPSLGPQALGGEPVPRRSLIQPHSPRPAAIIADTGGPVTDILIHYLPDLDDDLAPMYRSLFEALPAGIRIAVLCPSDRGVAQFADRWRRAASTRNRVVRIFNADRELTLWSRDRIIARWQGPGGQPAAAFVPASFPDYEPEKHNEIRLATFLRQSRVVPRVVTGALYLEGGNVVANQRHVFVGANIICDNETGYHSARVIESQLVRVTGRPTVLVGDAGGQVPWCHVDMYLTPIDDRRVLVASEALARAVTSTTLWQSLIDDPREPFRIDNENGSEHAPDHREDIDCTRQPALDDESCAIEERLDAVADLLRSLGYEVIRTPAIANQDGEWMITYNNVLMEHRDGRRHVYMPIYHLPQLDRLALETYRSLGFVVHEVDVSRLFDLGGALRCMVNVTGRKSSPRLSFTNRRIDLDFVGVPDRSLWEDRRITSRPPAPPMSTIAEGRPVGSGRAL